MTAEAPVSVKTDFPNGQYVPAFERLGELELGLEGKIDSELSYAERLGDRADTLHHEHPHIYAPLVFFEHAHQHDLEYAAAQDAQKLQEIRGMKIALIADEEDAVRAFFEERLLKLLTKMKSHTELPLYSDDLREAGFFNDLKAFIALGGDPTPFNQLQFR